jgi:hypothetical protein
MNPASQCADMLWVALVALLVAATGAAAQTPPASAPVIGRPASLPNASSPRAGVAQPVSTKAWSELSVAQQQALKPLAADWNSLDEARKRKWLAVSKNFNTMPPAEQAKLHSRMREWVALTPNQRTQARLNFAETTKVPADEKLAKWQAYQALSPDEKSRLAASAAARPTGAATAVKPVPAQKLATVPSAKPPRSGASGSQATVNSHRQVDQNTLLPRKPASAP